MKEESFFAGIKKFEVGKGKQKQISLKDYYTFKDEIIVDLKKNKDIFVSNAETDDKEARVGDLIDNYFVKGNEEDKGREG